MPPKESEAVPEEKGSIPLFVLPGGISLKDFRRKMSETMNKFSTMNSLFDQLEKTLEEIVEEIAEEQISVKRVKRRTLGSPVSPWRQTFTKIRRLTSARRPPLLHFK